MRRYITVMLIVVVVIASCVRNSRKPGREFMPDMVQSLAYEAYTTNSVFDDSMSSRLPADRTIPRGTFPNDTINSMNYLYGHYSADSEGAYLVAGEKIENPLAASEENIMEGKRLYTIHCNICHGDGTGNGPLVESEKFPAVPTSYFDPKILALTEGQMFHVLKYGRNMMGSYASQLSVDERWKVIHYVRSLQEDFRDKQTAQSAEAETVPEETNEVTNGEDVN